MCCSVCGLGMIHQGDDTWLAQCDCWGHAVPAGPTALPAAPPVDLKVKQASGKPILSLLPFHALVGAARVAEYGAAKYARGNWASATDDGAPERYLSAALRHLTSLQPLNAAFEWEHLSKVDRESGLPELDHIILGLLYLRGAAVKASALPEDPGLPVVPAKVGA